MSVVYFIKFFKVSIKIAPLKIHTVLESIVSRVSTVFHTRKAVCVMCAVAAYVETARLNFMVYLFLNQIKGISTFIHFTM